MGSSVVPMIVSILGACGLRIVWIYTIFAADRTLTMLYISYPVSWIITAGGALRVLRGRAAQGAARGRAGAERVGARQIKKSGARPKGRAPLASFSPPWTCRPRSG